MALKKKDLIEQKHEQHLPKAEDIPDYWKPKSVTDDEHEEATNLELELNDSVLLHEPGSIDVYSYDHETGAFTGVTKAFECQIEKGVYHLPAYTTKLVAPDVKDNEYARFNTESGDWEVCEKCIVKPSTIPVTILENHIRSQRNHLLLMSDYTQLADFGGDKKKAAKYRQALRDVPAQKGFPENVVWPEYDFK